MSDAATGSPVNVNTVGGFVRRAMTSSLGAKVVMAATGLIFYGWLVLHLLGNLAVFAGSGTENAYAHFLKGNPEILWAQRLAWMVIFPIHFISGIRLAALNRRARPQGYAAPRKWRESTLASRTMWISGVVVLAFFVFHILQFTWVGVANSHFADDYLVPSGNGSSIPDVFGMVVTAFKTPWVVVVYLIGVTTIGWHLAHGLWSGVQSLGLNGSRWTPFAKKAGLVLALLLAAAFASIPLGIFFNPRIKAVGEAPAIHAVGETPAMHTRP